MRALAQLLMTLGSTLNLRFLSNIGQGLSKTAMIGDRAKLAKRELSKSDKSKTDDTE